MPTLPVEEMKIVEVACATPASSPTRKLPLVSSIAEGCKLREEVAMFAIVFQAVDCTKSPAVRGDDVERPPHERVGVVPPLEMIGNVPDTDVT